MANGCVTHFDNAIVEEWALTKQPVQVETWRQLTPEQREHLIRREALDNGIQRPSRETVSFHYNARVEGHHFGSQHPMKPWRLTLTKQLVLSYGLQYAMDMYESRMATKAELAAFHSEEYLSFLARLNPRKDLDKDEKHLYLGDDSTSLDCPVFDGMWDYFRYYSGASLDGARALISDQSDIAINWSGGLHHAHKNKASGFCYINDIVVAIQQLLLTNTRVLYIDIDVHHGDGVEEAFFSTDRVLTLSFHNFAYGFFPETGKIGDIGPKDPSNAGAHHSLNVPLKPGISDDQWRMTFQQIAGAVIDQYNPSAVVLQCGADSLGGDRLGPFNLNIKAHGSCVEFVKDRCFNRKLLILGGGGYTPRNVARCWTHETAICVGAHLNETIPAHVPYRQAFVGAEHGDGRLYPDFDQLQRVIHENENTEEYLQSLVENIYEQLRYIQGAPSVQMQYIPNDYLKIREEEDARIKEEDVDMDRDMAEIDRRQLEENIGVEHELPMDDI
ncbi:putative histone deacetylase [Microthyrium microscopicum]|uniref:Histone deacetylase n=1 Tax=Microthyrium microscopicum TaxID=703497 RepID=A0A6A6UAH7_9PEZI|nr:putative histone deacetylase [Microthyrium microscopicum]